VQLVTPCGRLRNWLATCFGACRRTGRQARGIPRKEKYENEKKEERVNPAKVVLSSGPKRRLLAQQAVHPRFAISRPHPADPSSSPLHSTM
jgi:hypothetical protein